MARIPIGVQLYSVREDCEKDLLGTLTAVAKMGYEGVEFAGYYGRTAKELRKLLDDLGLKCCGTHIGVQTLLGDELPKTVEFNQTLGNPFLIVPGLPREYTESREAWRRTAGVFNEIADKLAPRKMKTGYHNHHTEFTPLDGEAPWDTFFGNTKKGVVMQYDVGNAAMGGGDAVTYLRRYPGRSETVHIKPYKKGDERALIGEDEMDWPGIFAACEEVGSTEWYIVEYESDAYAPVENIDRCLKALKAMGK